MSNQRSRPFAARRFWTAVAALTAVGASLAALDGILLAELSVDRFAGALLVVGLAFVALSGLALFAPVGGTGLGINTLVALYVGTRDREYLRDALRLTLLLLTSGIAMVVFASALLAFG